MTSLLAYVTELNAAALPEQQAPKRDDDPMAEQSAGRSHERRVRDEADALTTRLRHASLQLRDCRRSWTKPIERTEWGSKRYVVTLGRLAAKRMFGKIDALEAERQVLYRARDQTVATHPRTALETLLVGAAERTDPDVDATGIPVRCCINRWKTCDG